MKYIIANWKAHKNIVQARAWMEIFKNGLGNDSHLRQRLLDNHLCVIVCPSAPLIFPLRHYLFDMHNVFLGAQDISKLDSGSYTGEVTAASLLELVRHVIIGHSERRHFFAETEADIMQKLVLAIKYNLEPIHCVRGTHDQVHAAARIVAYEPVAAIGTGNNASVEAVAVMRRKLRFLHETTFLYGGSVSQYNCREYLEHPAIDGLLIGSASLDPLHFLAIAAQA